MSVSLVSFQVLLLLFFKLKCHYCPSDKCSAHAVNLLVDAVYSPYVPYLLDYPTLQQTFLTEQLQAPRLVNVRLILFIAQHPVSMEAVKATCTNLVMVVVVMLMLMIGNFDPIS